MDYPELRLIHRGLALVSLTGFVLRWTWMMNQARPFRQRLTRILPHVVDTLFLASGIWLPFLESIGRSPARLAAIEFNVTLPE